jgi:hypothetical protein
VPGLLNFYAGVLNTHHVLSLSSGETKGEPSRFLKMADRVYSEASHVEAVEGRVTVEGPDGVDVALTPDAAMKPPIACLSQRPKRRARR